MNSLSGKQGPRYKHLADESEPYETISVEKLTVPVPLPLDRERNRVLGQSLHPAPRDVGLLPHTRSGTRVTVKGERPV